MTREEVIKALTDRGVKRDRAVMYADQYVAYHKASENIAEFGPIIKNPRTGQAMPNPYLKVRDNAQHALTRLRIDAAFLW